MRRLLLLLALLAFPAHAAVTLTFYSRELGTQFPHAFVRITGATDAEPTKLLDDNYGFTARRITPAILRGPVPGMILRAPDGYVRHSDPHLSLTLTDAQFQAVLGLVAKWRDMPGRSYDLNHRNCVHFVGEIVRTLGLRADDHPELMKRPRSYLLELARENPGAR